MNRAGQPKHAITYEREVLAWQLRVRGHSTQEIADAIRAAGLGSITKDRVQSLLARLHARARDAMTEVVANEKARQLEALLQIQAEAHAAWLASKRPSRRVRRRVRDGDPDELTSEVVEQAGDARFLKAEIEALRSIRDILGLDAPKRAEIDCGVSVAEAIAEAERRDARYIPDEPREGPTDEQLALE